MDVRVIEELAGLQRTHHAALIRGRAEAEAEVARLNRLNADKGCVYFWQATRVVGDLPKVG